MTRKPRHAALSRDAPHRALIGGTWVATQATLEVESPARGEAIGRQLRLAKGIRSGQVFVNNYGTAGGIELPFGGVGRSGHGREKGFEGLRSYTRIKTVAIRHG